MKVWYKENHYTSEMSFLPNPNGTDEEDGVLITLVYDGEKEKSYVMLMDPSTFTPLNIAYLPHNIPWSAHGKFLKTLISIDTRVYHGHSSTVIITTSNI